MARWYFSFALFLPFNRQSDAKATSSYLVATKKLSSGWAFLCTTEKSAAQQKLGGVAGIHEETCRVLDVQTGTFGAELKVLGRVRSWSWLGSWYAEAEASFSHSAVNSPQEPFARFSAWRVSPVYSVLGNLPAATHLFIARADTPHSLAATEAPPTAVTASLIGFMVRTKRDYWYAL